jgi:uncharacterized membrane protein
MEHTALLNDPMVIFAYLASVLGLVFWMSSQPMFARLFKVTPPVIYAYFIPTISTTIGILPPASPVYDWMVRYLLPFALLLLMITVNLKSVAKLGGMALIMVMAGTLGIMIGGPVALFVFQPFLPDDAWMGFAALSGSWIGGTANMVAIAESVGTPDAMLGPIIVVDTVVGYGWMGVLLFFSGWQAWYDKRNRARTGALEETNRRLALAESHMHPVSLPWLAAIVGLGFAGAVAAVTLGETMPAIGDPTIISQTTWAVLIVVTVGLALSFTPLFKLEEHGASRLGYLALYMLLTAIGARADLRAVLDAPAFFAAGVLWIAIHISVLLIVARLIRAPLFFVATGSMANIGGPVSAPIVAGVYHPAMAPVGLLMAVVGYVLGIYAGLGTAWLLALVAG